MRCWSACRRGGWASLRALLVRVPARRLGVVVLAPADGTERRVPLTDGLLSLLLR